MTVEDFKDGSGLWVKTFYVDGFQHQTKLYQVWWNMKQRCNTGGIVQALHPTYKDCVLGLEFKDFQLFGNWYKNQVGCNLNYHLDKDILYRGNKTYSEDTCVLVPRSLNAFFCFGDASRGLWPIGVTRRKDSGKFRVQMNIDGVLKRFGQYTTPEEAHAAYKIAKEAEAYRWYKRLTGGEFPVDRRVIERMRTWKLEEQGESK